MKKIGLMRALAALTVVIAPATSSIAQTVTNVHVQKAHIYDQTSPTAVALRVGVSGSCDNRCVFFFKATVGGQNLGSIAAPVLSGPVDTTGLGAAWNNGRLS